MTGTQGQPTNAVFGFTRDILGILDRNPTHLICAFDSPGPGKRNAIFDAYKANRADMPEEKRRPFFLYIDEFQNFTTLAVANMVSELRKYKVGLILAHQHLHQLEPDVRHAVLANVGTLVVFRLGPEDAPVITREISPVFDTEDLLHLPSHNIVVKLMIDGAASRPFSGTTLHPNDLHIRP